MCVCRARMHAAVIGGLVADAATMPLHWIYDPAKIEALLQGNTAQPEFFQTPSSPFYHYETGELSPYGAEVEILLQAVAKRGGIEVRHENIYV